MSNRFAALADLPEEVAFATPSSPLSATLAQLVVAASDPGMTTDASHRRSQALAELEQLRSHSDVWQLALASVQMSVGDERPDTRTSLLAQQFFGLQLLEYVVKYR